MVCGMLRWKGSAPQAQKLARGSAGSRGGAPLLLLLFFSSSSLPLFLFFFFRFSPLLTFCSSSFSFSSSSSSCPSSFLLPRSSSSSLLTPLLFFSSSSSLAFPPAISRIPLDPPSRHHSFEGRGAIKETPVSRVDPPFGPARTAAERAYRGGGIRS